LTGETSGENIIEYGKIAFKKVTKRLLI